MTSIIQSKFNQKKLLTAELMQLDYDFKKATTLQEKVAIHNLIVKKGQERARNEEELGQIRTQNKVVEYAKLRKTKRRR